MKRRAIIASVAGFILLAGGTAGATTLGTNAGWLGASSSPAASSTPEPSATGTAAPDTTSTRPTDTATAAGTNSSPTAVVVAAASVAATATVSSSPTITATATTTTAASPTIDALNVTNPTLGGGGGGSNIVQVTNHADGRFKARGSVKLNQIPGPNVGPVNLAKAESSCTNCQTYAVALQVNLISRDAQRIVPENAAIALNLNCSGCRTVAIAFQYVHQVDDPAQVPKEVRDLIRDMDRELHILQSEQDLTIAEAEARILAVIRSYAALNSSLRQHRDEAAAPAGSATPAETPSPAPTAPAASTTPAETPTPAPTAPVAAATEEPAPTAGSTGTPTPTEDATSPASSTTTSGEATP